MRSWCHSGLEGKEHGSGATPSSESWATWCPRVHACVYPRTIVAQPACPTSRFSSSSISKSLEHKQWSWFQDAGTALNKIACTALHQFATCTHQAGSHSNDASPESRLSQPHASEIDGKARPKKNEAGLLQSQQDHVGLTTASATAAVSAGPLTLRDTDVSQKRRSRISARMTEEAMDAGIEVKGSSSGTAAPSAIIHPIGQGVSAAEVAALTENGRRGRALRRLVRVRLLLRVSVGHGGAQVLAM